CQYGSRDEFAIIEARQARPIETSSPLGATRLLWQAMHSLEGVNIGASCAAGPARLVACAATGDPVVMKTAASHNTSAGRTKDTRLPPAIEQPPFVPVPQEIGEELRGALVSAGHRHLPSAADHDVLAPADRDLHLRHDVPFGSRARFEL